MPMVSLGETDLPKAVLDTCHDSARYSYWIQVASERSAGGRALRK